MAVRADVTGVLIRRTGTALLGAGVLLLTLTACRSSAQSTSTAGAATVVPTGAAASATFGDTAKVKVQLLALDPVEELASARLAAPAYLIVLGVRPGREIELISPDESVASRSTSAGTVTLSLRRFEEPSPDANLRAETEFDRCVAQNEAAARRREQERTAKRDASGRIIPGSGSSGSTPVRSAGCQKPRAQSKPIRLPARAPAERYLVVLASTHAIPYAQLSARLETLTAVAPDVATTLEAIAAGIYAGMPGTFSGTYVAW